MDVAVGRLQVSFRLSNPQAAREAHETLLQPDVDERQFRRAKLHEEAMNDRERWTVDRYLQNR